MELLLTKPVVVALAVLGALLSVCASVFGAKELLNPLLARRLNVVAYILMGASMLLFALAGLRGAPG